MSYYQIYFILQEQQNTIWIHTFNLHLKLVEDAVDFFFWFFCNFNCLYIYIYYFKKTISTYLSEIRDDLSALHPSIIILVNQQRFYHHEDLVHVRPNQIVQLVQNAVNHLNRKTLIPITIFFKCFFFIFFIFWI